ncbi:MAG TPA: cation:proton antiporter regulatory subunit [Microthrixaceae bacterium]|nr:cation:proton antiporter regulatory subunit [Microthrixaceae bacterium]
MADVTETQLPGVGVRHEFTTSTGERVGVVSHRTGRREIVVYDRRDPDACSTVMNLAPDDTRTLAELLGASRVNEALTVVQQQVEGLAIEWIRISHDSEMVDQTIGDGALRTRTGAYIVAVVRGDETVPGPGPEFELKESDVVVAVGTVETLAVLARLLGIPHGAASGSGSPA